MKALTVAQPWASLIVAGIKTLETRPSPPNGSMRPDGVRGLPGLAIEPGERIAIHAAAAIPGEVEGWDTCTEPARIRDPRDRNQWITVQEWWIRDGDGGLIELPLGAIVGTVTVTDVAPIVEQLGTPDDPLPRICNCDAINHGLRLMRPGTFPSEDISDQLPLGDFTPGRWGWLLTDPERCEPVPVRGRQGVWEWTP